MSSTKHFSCIQERIIADYLGGSVVAGSGASDCYPGDIQFDGWLGECKTHVSAGKRICFNLKVWKKISEEATSKFRFPALFVDDGSQKIDRTWVMFSYRTSCPLDTPICPIDLTIRANITFKHEDMLRIYKEYVTKFGRAVVLSVQAANTYLGICPLSSFRSIFCNDD